MTKIFINPGHSRHGIPDCGCIYNDIKECDIAFQIGERLEKCLKFNNFQTQLYQQTGYDNNANKQLNSVASLANALKADMLISIHMNGVANSNAIGTETFFSNGSFQGKLIAGYINTELIKPYHTPNYYLLANRGTKIDTRGLAVLKYTKMPAVLTEVGFISNPKEAEFIKTNVNEIAQRICNGICNYFNQTIKIYQDTIEQIKKYPQEIILTHISDGKYDVNVDLALKLNSNKLLTCLEWIKKTYV